MISGSGNGCRNNRSWHQQGAALIMVLVVTSVVAIAAVSISEQTQLSIYLTSNQKDRIQAARYIDAAEQRALLILGELKSTPTVNLGQKWASNTAFEVDKGTIETRITDLRACFNLNVLADQVEQRAGLGLESKDALILEAFLSLLEIPAEESKKFIYQLKDWVDPDSEISKPYGFEHPVTAQSDDKQLTADAPLAGMDELLFLQTPNAVLKNNEMELCVLPIGAGNTVNINTVKSPLLLSALSLGEFDVSAAQEIINLRPPGGYNSLDEFMQAFNANEQQIIGQMPLSVTSNYFRIVLSVHYGKSTLHRIVYVKMGAGSSKILRRKNGHG